MARPGPVLLALACLVYLFLLGPLAIVAAAAFSSSDILVFPPRGFTTRWFANVFEVSAFLDTFIISMQVAIGGTAAALILGLPAAYALNRFQPPGAAMLRNLFVLPILVPGVVFGFAALNKIEVIALVALLDHG